jgi:hypothetical protein
MYELERARDLEAWASLFNPQARETFPFDDGSNDVICLDAIRAATAHKSASRLLTAPSTTSTTTSDPVRFISAEICTTGTTK